MGAALRAQVQTLEVDVLRPQFVPAEMLARWRELQRLEGAWDSPFLSPYWPRAVERAQDGVDRGLRILILMEQGRPQGFMAVRAGPYTAMPAGAPMSDYEAVVADPELEVDPERLLKALGVQRFDFTHMLGSQSAFAPFAKGRQVSWVVDVAGGYEAYAAERRAAGSTALKDLDKKRRKAEREAGPLRFTAESPERGELERLVELKREQYRGTGQTDVFAAGWPHRLVRNLMSVREPGFGGALFTLHMGDELAAAQFHLMGEHTVHTWIVAHEPKFERYSPGLLLFQDILRWMDATPYDRMDFGYGDYRFKRELSNANLELMHGFVGRPSAATLVRGAAYGVRRAAESLPLGPVSALPGKAMRRLDLIRGLR